MERSLQSRYLNSQDQLIISLNEQIEAMTPLKQSYSSLQRYHIKLVHDFESLIAENDHVSGAYSLKIQELLHINEELDAKKNQYIEQLRNLENQKAKLTLERKNMMACCETLSSKFNLESEQNILLQQRTRQIVESIKKTEQSISVHRKIIAEIEAQIRLKSDQNTQIEDEVMRRNEFNRKSTLRIQNTQSQIKTCTTRNEKTIEQIKAVDKCQDDLESKIRDQLKKIKDTNEKIITRREQLAHLSHQKQYYTRLIESELIIKEDLDISQTKLNGLLERRSKQCDRVSKEIHELQQSIHNEQQKCSKSIKYKDSLSCHLSQLIKANGILLETMRKCCKEDQKVHHVLHKKLDGLDCALIRTAGTASENVFKKTVLRERTNQLFGSKQAQKSGSTWIKQLDIENI